MKSLTPMRVRAITRDRALVELLLEVEVHGPSTSLQRTHSRVAMDLRYWISTKTTAEIPRDHPGIHLALRPLPREIEAVAIRLLGIKELGVPLLPEVEDTYSDNTPPTLIPPPEGKYGVLMALLLLIVTLTALFWVTG